ncbi:hypothetical protein FBUS_07741 [Fasciolopsis buskii]|uniref:Uncharacterized protein n=1 Tax=Fasciolopsis buskii TaxID=27845 RepID=A0A8E0RIY6_9TREM|nr:hypothetical protein FBUS_07741 [Fasciolopsis buski]
MNTLLVLALIVTVTLAAPTYRNRLRYHTNASPRTEKRSETEKESMIHFKEAARIDSETAKREQSIIPYDRYNSYDSYKRNAPTIDRKGESRYENRHGYAGRFNNKFGSHDDFDDDDFGYGSQDETYGYDNTYDLDNGHYGYEIGDKYDDEYGRDYDNSSNYFDKYDDDYGYVYDKHRGRRLVRNYDQYNREKYDDMYGDKYINDYGDHYDYDQYSDSQGYGSHRDQYENQDHYDLYGSDNYVYGENGYDDDDNNGPYSSGYSSY